MARSLCPTPTRWLRPLGFWPYPYPVGITMSLLTDKCPGVFRLDVDVHLTCLSYLPTYTLTDVRLSTTNPSTARSRASTYLTQCLFAHEWHGPYGARYQGTTLPTLELKVPPDNLTEIRHRRLLGTTPELNPHLQWTSTLRYLNCTTFVPHDLVILRAAALGLSS